MSNFPNSPDDDASIPPIVDNISTIGGDVINALRSAVFAIESNIGIGAAGSQSSIASFLTVAHNQDGTLSTAALLNLLSSLSITDAQVSGTAAIQETKIALTHSTASLYNFYAIINGQVEVINNFISVTGIKVEPHIAGTAYNHNLSAILIDQDAQAQYINRFQTNRDYENANTLLLDINTDFVNHERADGTSPSPVYPQSSFETVGGKIVPSNYAHSAGGIHIDSSGFSTIPPQTTDLQTFAEEVDILIGNGVQNLSQNGILRASRSTVLSQDGYAENVVPPTPVTAYLLAVPPGPKSSTPVDDINIGDDIIVFDPSSSSLSSASFDAAFAQVRPADVITINYGNGTAAQFAIDSVKSVISGSNRVYAVRIIGKNLFSSSNASARIDKSLFHKNKYGVLSTARSAVLNSNGQNAVGACESLTVVSPKGAMALGNGFVASQIDQTHYNLYLTLYPTGNPSDQFINLPAIDVSGNKGKTPGTYTLDSIINATNLAFRAPGYNYRFIAFEYQGSFGIALADSYNNAAFSIVGNTVDGYGNQLPAISTYSNNVVDGYFGIDGLGIGVNGSNLASPPYTSSYQTPIAANIAPTLIFYALRKNYFLVNGSERDSLKSDPNSLDQIVDVNGDGYWPAMISSVNVNASSVTTSYTLNYDISTSGIKAGKTIVVQPAFALTDSRYSFIDYGRFVIKSVSFSGCDGYNPETTITVYDAVQGTGNSPYATSNNIPVNIYFSDDSVSFDAQNVADSGADGNFKRFFEIYVDQNGHTFTHERARFALTSSSISNINFIDVSSKLRGYTSQKIIQLNIVDYFATSGTFDGYLSNGYTNFGATVTGKKGEVVRYYDETNIDYLEFEFIITDNVALSPIPDLSIQLFPSLQGNQNFFLLATCQIDDSTLLVSNIKDRRQFGNVSETQFSDSAISLIESSAKYTEQNGIIRGFDYITTTTNQLSFKGGLVLVDGAFVNVNNFFIEIPLLQDYSTGVAVPGILWAVCVNKIGEPQLVALTDYNSSVNNINNPGRLLNVINTFTNTSYYIDSSTFTTILNYKKELTILYLVNAQVANSTSYSFVVSDARKFATDSSANSSLVLTQANSQGSLHSMQALLSWITYNSSMQSKVVLRGMLALTTDPQINVNMSISGDGAATISSTTSFTVAGAKFDNITFNVIGGITVTNTTFTNCTFNCISQILVNSGCSFINCTFNANLTGQIPTPVKIASTSSNVRFDGCNVSYVPSTTGTTYSASNLINSGYGFIYCSVVSVQNVSIKNCNFATTSSTRFSFINFEYAAYTNNAQSIYIEQNKFTNTSIVDDNYAIISFVCTIVDNANFLSTQPVNGLKLIDSRIERNTCDKNQLIAIVGSINEFNIITATISTVGCSISKNICGLIGISVANEYDRNYFTNTDNFAYGQSEGISIDGNNCKFIGSLISNGQWLDGGTQTVYSQAANTAPITIEKNYTSWIQFTPTSTASSFDQTQIVNIKNNSLRAYNSSFLTSVGGSSASNIGILCSGFGSFSIIGNTVSTGKYNTTGSTTNYDYLNALTTAQGTYTIDGNTFNGLISSGDMLKFLNTSTLRIVNNNFIRNSTTLTSYINVTTSGVNALITNNYFDQSTIDGTSYNLITSALPAYLGTVSFIQNRNQVVFTSVDANNLSWNTVNLPNGYITFSFSNLPDGFGGVAPMNIALSTPNGALSMNFTAEIDLQQYIPPGAKLLYAVAGVYANKTLSGEIRIAIGKGNSNAFTIGSFGSSIAAGSGYAALYNGSYAAVGASPTYTYVDVSSDNIVSNAGQSISLLVDFVNVATTANSDYINFSPTLLKYQW